MPSESAIHDDLDRAWCLTLLHDFRRLQDTIPALRTMRAPNIKISKDLTDTLGHWDEDCRTVTLAERLVRRAGLRDVTAVFRHEVAHQIVSELYAIRGAQAHGEAFRRACALLEIPAKSTLAVDLPEDGLHAGDRGVLARVRKLLALGTSSNTHEAESALAKAHELALRHNLDLVAEAAGMPSSAPHGPNPNPNADRHDRYDVRLLAPVFKRVPSYIWPIATMLSESYFTTYICRGHRDADGKRVQTIELYGTPENLELAEYVWYFLLHQGELAWNAYRRSEGRTKGRHKTSFLNGLFEGFRETLDRRAKHLASTKALVWLGDPKLDAFYRRRNPHVSTRSVSPQVEREVHAAGHDRGKKLRLRPGLGTSSRSEASPARLEDSRRRRPRSE